MALKFSNAHECNGTDNDAQMDYWNNDIGHLVAEQYPEVGANVIADRICDKLEAGRMKVLLDENDPNSDLIDSNLCNCN